MSLLADLDREQVRRGGFYEFVRRAWSQVETATFVDNWHINVMCQLLQCTIRGSVRDLLINIPPGFSKSLIVSTLFPAWVWTEKPDHKFICASYDPGISLRDAKRHFELINGDWYRERWGVLLDGDVGRFAYGDFSTTSGGFRITTSIRGQATGRHAHTLIFDDPHKPLDIEKNPDPDSGELLTVKNWWKGTVPTRRASPVENFVRIGVMQRLHEDDLSGVFLQEGDVEHLCLPMRYDPERPCKYDIRTVKGELLCPQRFDETTVAKMEKLLGAINTAAQFGQTPTPPHGAIFKKEHFKHFNPKDVPFLSTYSVVSVDASFKNETEASDVAIEVWGKLGPFFYCYHSVSDTMDLWQTLDAIAIVYAMFPATGLLVEDKANGPAIIGWFRKKLSNVLAFDPKSSKEARAMAASVHYQAGAAHHAEGAEWLERKESNLLKFPRGSKKDDVDATAQALLYLADSFDDDFLRAVAIMSSEAGSKAPPKRENPHFTLR